MLGFFLNNFLIVCSYVTIFVDGSTDKYVCFYEAKMRDLLTDMKIRCRIGNITSPLSVRVKHYDDFRVG